MVDEIYLSIIIISRDIERFIGGCIEAVISASQHIENKEIILIDSQSKDRTTEIASRYPIQIFKIKDGVPLSASAGRYIGSIVAKGNFIHFQDGDSIMNTGWFKYAMPFLESNPDIAGVVGLITQEPYDNFMIKNWIMENREQKIGKINSFEEAILIRRAVLEKVGSFNPWLKAKEEGELSARILNAGYTIQRLNCKMSHHIGGRDFNRLKLFKQRIINMYELGRIFRLHLGEKGVRDAYIKENKLSFYLIASYAFFFTFLLLSYALNNQRLLYLSSSLFFLVYMWYLMIHRAYIDSLVTLASMTVRIPLFMAGFLKKPKNVLDYQFNLREMDSKR